MAVSKKFLVLVVLAMVFCAYTMRRQAKTIQQQKDEIEVLAVFMQQQQELLAQPCDNREPEEPEREAIQQNFAELSNSPSCPTPPDGTIYICK